MGKILVVKGADFSDFAVAKVDILENPYYEEAERLIGDGAAAINTLFVQDSSGLEVETKVQLKTVDNTIPQNIISNFVNDSTAMTRLLVLDYLSCFYAADKLFDISKGYISNHYSPIEINGVYAVKFDKDSVFVNGISIGMSEQAENEYAFNNTPLGLFARVGGAIVSDCDFIGHTIFRVDGVKVREFVPCVLKQNIPAGLASDGNSHNAGECGMWDIIGDKFYGNYNQSGTFRVA